ncbi:hypothetical protein C5748_16285 [Phyllobacterium phragmitis]|uniref:Uncharacterized protein n=1 Tax=Phyllobacterium phragmitis TaxID=2670329 RepID=A0A2S9IP96_9HYPH|nr:hypothetical protein [Phyllobacterium phragmitis]PRD42351.1 hypothetical protein C5748_16285 [Phyllobacterium phragmitis]
MTKPETARATLKKIEAGEPLRLLIGRFPDMSEIVLEASYAARLREKIAMEMALLADGDEPGPGASPAAAIAEAETAESGPQPSQAATERTIRP